MVSQYRIVFNGTLDIFAETNEDIYTILKKDAECDTLFLFQTVVFKILKNGRGKVSNRFEEVEHEPGKNVTGPSSYETCLKPISMN